MTTPRISFGSSIMGCVRRLARLQVTQEMQPPPERVDRQDQTIDRLILAARRAARLGAVVLALSLAFTACASGQAVSPAARAAAEACADRPLWSEGLWIMSGGLHRDPAGRPEHPAAWHRRQATCMAERGFGPAPPTYAQDAERCSADYGAQGPQFESCMVLSGWRLDEVRAGGPR